MKMATHLNKRGKHDPAQRRKDFKKTLDAGQCREKRLQDNLFISKQERSRLLSEKRKKLDESFGNDEHLRIYSDEEVEKLVFNLKHSTEDTVLSNLVLLRKMLCVEEPPISKVLEAGIVPVLCYILTSEAHDENAMLEATWCCTNLCVGSSAEVRLVTPVVPILVAHLSGHHPVLREQALSCLGNLASDGPELRNYVRDSGVIKTAIHMLATADEAVMKASAFLLCNLIRGEGRRPGDLIQAGVARAIDASLNRTGEFSTRVEVAWLLSYLTAGGEKIVDELLKDFDAIEWICTMFNFVQDGEAAAPLLVPLLRTASSIIAGPDVRIASFLAAPNFLRNLVISMQCDHRAVKKESVWLVSNLASSDKSNVQMLINADGMVSTLVDLLLNYAFDIRKEAGFALVNMAIVCGVTSALVDLGVLKGYVKLLASHDMEAKGMSLAFLESALRCHPNAVALIQAEDGIDALEETAMCQVPKLSGQASFLVDKYYSDIPDDVEMDMGGGDRMSQA